MSDRLSREEVADILSHPVVVYNRKRFFPTSDHLFLMVIPGPMVGAIVGFAAYVLFASGPKNPEETNAFWVGLAAGASFPFWVVLRDWAAHAENQRNLQKAAAFSRRRRELALIWHERYQKEDAEVRRLQALAAAKYAAKEERRQQEIERERQKSLYDQAVANRQRALEQAEERFRQMLRDKTFELAVGRGINDPEIVAQQIRSALDNSPWLASEDAMLLTLSTDQAIRETLGPLIERLPKPPPLVG